MLKLSKTDRVVGGVIGGIAEYLKIDSSLLRWLFVASVVFGVGSPIGLYLIAWLLMAVFGTKDN